MSEAEQRYLQHDRSMGHPKCILGHPSPSFCNGNVLILWEHTLRLYGGPLLLVYHLSILDPLLIRIMDFEGEKHNGFKLECYQPGMKVVNM